MMHVVVRIMSLLRVLGPLEACPSLFWRGRAAQHAASCHVLHADSSDVRRVAPAGASSWDGRVPARVAPSQHLDGPRLHFRISVAVLVLTTRCSTSQQVSHSLLRWQPSSLRQGASLYGVAPTPAWSGVGPLPIRWLCGARGAGVRKILASFLARHPRTLGSTSERPVVSTRILLQTCRSRSRVRPRQQARHPPVGGQGPLQLRGALSAAVVLGEHFQAALHQCAIGHDFLGWVVGHL